MFSGGDAVFALPRTAMGFSGRVDGGRPVPAGLLGRKTVEGPPHGPAQPHVASAPVPRGLPAGLKPFLRHFLFPD